MRNNTQTTPYVARASWLTKLFLFCTWLMSICCFLVRWYYTQKRCNRVMITAL